MIDPTARVRALIIDDEPLARKRLRTLLASEDDIHVVGEAGNGTAAVAAITSLRPDLLFLDVQMPGLDGFEILRATAAVHQPFVIFVTAHDEHAIRAFEVEAIDYVLKPVVEARLRAAVRKVVKRMREQPNEELARSLAQLLTRVAPVTISNAGRLPIKRDGITTFVRVADIDWVHADGDLMYLHTGATVHSVRETMSEMETKLPQPPFVRVHRSIIVNSERIREIQPWFKGDYVLVLHDGTKVRSGRTYRDRVQALVQ